MMAACRSSRRGTTSKHARICSHLRSWVMLSPSTTPPYTPLANEQTLFTSPPRIGLSISTPTQSKQQQSSQPPFALAHSSGIVYLTNRRIIYLPDKASDRLKSFAAPILNLHDSHVTAPFFGPNVWTALLQPVAGGGIPAPSIGVVELKLTFKEGGAFDFHTRYERVRERLHQAAEVARIDGDSNSRSGRQNGVDDSNVTLEDLPAYEERNAGPLLTPTAGGASGSLSSQQQQRTEASSQQRHSKSAATATTPFQPPDEPPPGYEEAQMAGLQVEAERRMHEDERDGDDDDGRENR